MPKIFSIKPTLDMRGRKFKGIRGFSGKPFHPPLTDIPVAGYILAAVFDVISYVSYTRDATSTLANDFFISATHVMVAAALVSVPTIITGFWDWLKSTPRGTQAWRTANWHMAVMLTTSVLAAADILLRLGYWDAGYSEPLVMILSLIVGGMVAFGAMYGGTMVYEYAFNVEMGFDHAYTPSEEDHRPGQENAPKQGD